MLYLSLQWKVKVKVAQLCPPLCYTANGIHFLERVTFLFCMGSSQPRIEPRSPALQADSLSAEPQGSPRILESVAYPISRGSSWPRNRTRVSCIAGRFFTNWAIKEALFSDNYRTRVSCIAGRFFTNWAIKEALFSDNYQGSSLLLYSNKIFKLLKNLRTVDYYVHESNITFHCDPGKFAALSLELTLFKFSQRWKQLTLIVDTQ